MLCDTHLSSLSFNSSLVNKFKAFADNKINVTQILKFVLGRVENKVEKEKMLLTSIFSFSHHVF